MKSNIYISSNLRYLRKKYKKTQNDIAKLCNKKNTAISNWEKGIREPNAIDLAILAKTFNISIDDLILKDLKDDINSK